MSRFARSDFRYAETLACIASRAAASMSSTRSGTEKTSVIDTVTPLPAEAEVDRDGNALERASIRAYAVREPAREHDEHAGLRRKPLRLAERRAVGAGERQERRVHDGRDAARVLDLELAAERSIGADAAVVDIVGRRPERARVRVELIAVALAVHVGPAVDAPL